MRLPALSIRWKMTLVYTGLLTVLLVTFGLFLYGAVEQFTIRSVETTFTPRFEQAMQAGPSIIAELPSHQPSGASKPLAVLERLSGPGFFRQVRDQTGQVIATSSNLGQTLLPPPTKLPLSKSQPQQDLIRLPVVGLLPEAATTDITSAHFLLRSGLLVDAHQQVVGLLEVAQSLFIVDEVQDQLIDVLLVGIAIAVALAMLIGGWLAGRLLCEEILDVQLPCTSLPVPCHNARIFVILQHPRLFNTHDSHGNLIARSSRTCNIEK